MVNVETLINILPADGSRKLLRKRQSMDNIIDDLLYKHQKNEQDCNKIAKYFWRGNVKDTAKFLFDFCKENIDYKIEKTLEQSVRSIGRILIDGKGDCKHYASFIVGICCALRRMGYPIRAKYRFAVYPEPPRTDGARSGHVFAVITDAAGNQYWTDPVLKEFNQRYPKYISHEDKIPPMGSANIGEVWELNGINTGFGNDTTLAGMANGTTLGYIGEYFDRDSVGRHHNRMLDNFIDSPLNPLHPGIYMPGSSRIIHFRPGHHGHHPGNVRTHSQGSAQAMPRIADMRLVNGVYEDIGKVKHHIKIQPGKFLKKATLGVGLAPSRNAFLLYLKLNLFHTGSQMWSKAQHNPAFKKKLYDLWDKIGGNHNKLNTALTQAMHVWNKHHAAHKISGSFTDMMSGGDLMDGVSDELIGVAPLAFPAILAAAAPIIKIFTDLMKQNGIAHAKPGDVVAADGELVKAHNKATSEKGDGNADLLADGSVDHGAGITTKVTADPATGMQQLEYNVKEPVVPYRPATAAQSVAPGGAAAADDDGGGGDQPAPQTKEVTTTNNSIVPDKGSSSGIMAFFDKTKTLFVAHKWTILGTVAGGLLIWKVVIPFVQGYRAKPKRR